MFYCLTPYDNAILRKYATKSYSKNKISIDKLNACCITYSGSVNSRN